MISIQTWSVSIIWICLGHFPPPLQSGTASLRSKTSLRFPKELLRLFLASVKPDTRGNFNLKQEPGGARLPLWLPYLFLCSGREGHRGKAAVGRQPEGDIRRPLSERRRSPQGGAGEVRGRWSGSAQGGPRRRRARNAGKKVASGASAGETFFFLCAQGASFAGQVFSLHRATRDRRGMEKVRIGALLVALLSGCQADAGPMQCPIVNKSILEGSSEVIVPDISKYPNSLLLCKKNHSSSVCTAIANIRNGILTPFLSAYVAHFSVSEHGLEVVNATRFLRGEYQLCNHLTENCLQRFFLDVLASGSERTPYGAIVAAAAVVAAVALLVLGLFALWCKWRRGRPAHSSTGIPDTGNESLHPAITIKELESTYPEENLEKQQMVCCSNLE